MESLLQDNTPVILSGSSPRRGARRASQAFSKSGMTHFGLFEWYWRRRSDVALPAGRARKLASACGPAGRNSRQSSVSDAAGWGAAEAGLRWGKEGGEEVGFRSFR